MRSRPFEYLLSSLLVAVTVFVATVPVHAAQADDDPLVEKTIQDGIALRRAGNDEGALTLFLGLEHRSPDSVRVLLHITAAAQATGRWLLAYEYLRKTAAFKSDPYYLRNRAAVSGVEEAVARHVGQFRVVGEPAGAEVRLNGNLLGRLPFKEPVAVELGSYVLEVSKSGFYPLRREITISAGGALSQEVVELSPSQAASTSAPAVRVNTPAGGAAASVTDTSPTWWQSRSVTWTLAGIAAASAGAAGVTLAIRESKIARWNDDSACIDRQAITRSRADVCGVERDDANTAGTVAVVSGVTAALFATASLTHWLTTAPKSSTRAKGGPSASCGAGLASVVCSGTF